MKFTEMLLPVSLLEALAARGYHDAMPVQQAVLDATQGDRDLLVSSQTGSGKTVAFGLAVAAKLLGTEQLLGRIKHPKVLVVAPTRELALQVARELAWLFRPAGGRLATCVGGMDIRAEIRALQQSPHIVVGTPGRVCDHLERKSLVLGDLQAVILDEADEMLDMGFREELERILGQAPKERRTLMFSATLPKEIEGLARRFSNNAVRVTASSIVAPHQDIDYVAHLIAPREREHAVVNVLRYHDAASALVFGATREGVAHLHASLVERGFLAVAISGELNQGERNRAIIAIRDGRARVLVGTDVAARGLDLPAVALVVHADLPHDALVLQHRSGRTGRAGRKGTAVVLAPYPARRVAERMARAAHIDLQWSDVPTSEKIRALDQQRLLRDVGALLADSDPEDAATAEALVREYPAQALASALVRIGRRRLPSAEDLPLTTAWRAGPGPAHERRADDRQPSARQSRMADGVWFRMNVGREGKADPRWLIPIICRRGKVSKSQIGRIDILTHETRFEVAASAARIFAREMQKPDKKDGGVRFQRMPGQNAKRSAG
jgi:ATP-dependent RNA helicase DeaD